MSSGANISVMMVRGILLVTVPTDPSDEVIAELQEAVLDAMVARRAQGLILDIATVEILDSYFARTLSETAQMVRLMGGTTVLTGMRPTVAITVTELGLQMADTLTALNVDRAIAKLEDIWTGKTHV